MEYLARFVECFIPPWNIEAPAPNTSRRVEVPTGLLPACRAVTQQRTVFAGGGGGGQSLKGLELVGCSCCVYVT